MKANNKNVLFFSLMVLSLWTSHGHATRTVEDYLSTQGDAPKIMVIGEGHAYNNYDVTFYHVDNAEGVNPDLVDDVTTQEKLSQVSEDAFDRILLCNIPTNAFNGEIEKGEAKKTETGFTVENPDLVVDIFKGLARLLKTGGTLEFNDMWGGNFAQDEHQKQQFHGFLTKGLLNPFNQWLTQEDFGIFNEERLHFEAAYVSQLKEFFQNAGFSDCVMTQRNLGASTVAQRPYKAATFVTHPGWFVVTK